MINRPPAGGEIEPAGGDVVDAELVSDEAGGAARPWQTQTERDRAMTPEEAAAVFERIAKALAPNTRDAYRKAWQRFLRWCVARGRTPYPLTLETILLYLHAMSQEPMPAGRPAGLSISSVDTFLAAAKRVCLYYADPRDPQGGWLGGHQSVTDWVKAYRKERNADPERRPRQSAGARQAIMRALLDVLPDTPAGKRDRAMMLFAYYMAARRSELVALTFADVRVTVDGLEVYIASSKTDKDATGVWVAVPSNDVHPEYDPFTAWQEWTAECDRQGIGTARGALFRAVDRYGHIRTRGTGAMDGQAVDVAVTRARTAAYEAADYQAKRGRTKQARKAGAILAGLLDPKTVKITPHSFRRGFATDARLAGWDLLEIARGGRWSPTSRVLHIYIEEIEKWLRHQHNPMVL